MNFGKSLELILKSKGMTVAELAAKTKIAPTTLYSLLKRDGNKIDIGMFLRICDALDVRPKIFGEKSDFEKIDTSFSFSDNFNSDEYTEEELEEIRQFAEFVKSKRKDNK